jgi:LuxR family transcriptional regulator
MTYDVVGLAAKLEQASSPDERLDLICRPLDDFGFSSFVYDYSPVPVSHDGRIIPPTFMMCKNVPSDFRTLWLSRGYTEIDPVQALMTQSLTPFVWSLLDGGNAVIRPVLRPDHRPAIGYLLGAALHLAETALLGALFNKAIYATLDPRVRTCQYVRLTRRERECLQWCARGLTAKEIAHRLGRSVGTVTMHINNATHKLRAKSRPQAVARAAYYHLLDGAC